MAKNSMLTIENVTLRVAGRLLLDNAQLALNETMKIGLVGQNGVGKTSFFRAILQEIPLESGTISLAKNVRIGQVTQEFSHLDKSVLQNVLAGDKELCTLLAVAETETDPMRLAEIHARLLDKDAYSAQSRASAILAGLGLDNEAQQKKLQNLSGGWRMRVALAALLFAEPDLLLLDEPTNYLDLEGTLWLSDYIRHYPHTVLMISHDRDLLNRAANAILHFDHKKITLWKGNYDHFIKQRSEKIALQTKQAAKQQAQRKKLESFITRFKAKASKAKQAQSRVKMLEKLETIDIWQETEAKNFHFPHAEKKLASPIITLSHVAIGYQEDAAILKDITLRIDHDDRIALLGANGNGKSTFAKLLVGRLAPQKGDMHKAPHLKIAFFSQHQIEDLHENENAIEHVRRLWPSKPEASIRSRIAQMGLSSEKMATKVKHLSGGEKSRLLMGLITLEPIHLLILDEPTNHLDIESREALIEALNNFEGAVLLIAHDRYLIEATMERLWRIEQGRVFSYEGDMEDYHAEILRCDKKIVPSVETKEQIDKANLPNKKEQRKRTAEKNAALAPLKKKIRHLEQQIEKIQKEISAIDAQLADNDFYQKNPDKIVELTSTRAEFHKKLNQIEEEWLIYYEEHEEKKAE